MEINLYLLLSLLIALLVISYLLGKLHRVRGQLFLIRDALNDIKAGNLNHRVLARESDLTKQICYDINEIAMSSQSRLIQQKQSEQAYKRLMTSLSHDVKTPLASLVGYLEAVESKMVTGAEKEEYIRVAMEKAHHLKDFVTALFEWVKLDAGEQIFHFEVCDLNELSRDIMADWVPLLENHDLSYEIEIPETEYMTRVDSTAYTRMEEIRFPRLHRLQRQVQKRRTADEILTFSGIPPIYTRGIRKPQMPLVTYQSAIYSVSVFT